MARRSTASKHKGPSGGRPRPSGGRVTPKGGARPEPRRAKTPGDETDWEAERERYVAAARSGNKASPTWWPVLMFGLLGLGILLIVLDYTGLLPGTPNNWMLIPAILCLGGGLFAAMSYR